MVYKIINRQTGDFNYQQDVKYCFENDDLIELMEHEKPVGVRRSTSYRKDLFDVKLVASEGPVHEMRM